MTDYDDMTLRGKVARIRKMHEAFLHWLKLNGGVSSYEVAWIGDLLDYIDELEGAIQIVRAYIKAEGGILDDPWAKLDVLLDEVQAKEERVMEQKQ